MTKCTAMAHTHGPTENNTKEIGRIIIITAKEFIESKEQLIGKEFGKMVRGLNGSNEFKFKTLSIIFRDIVKK